MESKSISGVTSTYISSLVCPTDVVHVLLHVEVTPNIDLMGGSRGGDRGSGPPPPGKSQKYRVSYQYKATKPALNVGPSSARQRNAI